MVPFYPEARTSVSPGSNGVKQTRPAKFEGNNQFVPIMWTNQLAPSDAVELMKCGGRNVTAANVSGGNCRVLKCVPVKAVQRSVTAISTGTIRRMLMTKKVTMAKMNPNFNKCDERAVLKLFPWILQFCMKLKKMQYLKHLWKLTFIKGVIENRNTLRTVWG